MAKNTTKSRGKKPAKPSKDFPLFPHQNGQWCRKIRGRQRYFGSWADPDSALKRYLDEKDDWYAGRTPQPKTKDLTIAELGDEFLTAKEKRLHSAELSIRSFRDYHATAQRFADILGKNRTLRGLTPRDFETLREELSKRDRTKPLSPTNKRSAVTLGNDIIRIKTILKWAYDQRKISFKVETGESFSKPSRKAIRRERRLKGPRMFEATELRKLIDKADSQLKAMLLLAINTGYGNHDLASLPLSAIDLKEGWATHPRPKTETERRCPLWNETIEALKTAIRESDKIKASMQTREQANLEEVSGLVFVTKYGYPWVRANENTWIDGISQQFLKLRKELDLNRNGLGFYSIRHTFSTVGGGALDPIAVNFLMGHVDDSVPGMYRERIDDERLRAVVNVVHNWLFPPKSTKGKRSKKR